MSLSFFNTMTRKREPFQSIDAGRVRMYTCGPTVYNYAHIGNLRAYIFEDQLRRYLQFKGYEVLQVMNLTDVDDKIIRKCKELNVPLMEYTQPFKQAFFDGLHRLNIQDAEHYPEASAHISDMEDMIEQLVRADMAECQHCQKVYDQTGMVPVWCSYQQRVRDFTWVKAIEDRARENLNDGLPVVHIPNRHQE